MNLFTGKSPYYHVLKYLLFLLKYPVYIVFEANCKKYVSYITHYLLQCLFISFALNTQAYFGPVMVIARQQLPRDVINLCTTPLLFQTGMLELYSLISLEYKKYV